MAFTVLHNNWSGWAAAGAGVSAELISLDQFESENPGFTSPVNHSGPIAKVTSTIAGDLSNFFLSPRGQNTDITQWTNVAFRCFVPESSLTYGSANLVGLNLVDSAFNQQSSRALLFGTSQTAENNRGHVSFIGDPADTTTIISNFGNKPAGLDSTAIDQFQMRQSNSALTSVTNPCVVYYFDIWINVTVDRPRVIFSMDDGAITQFTIGHLHAQSSADNIPITYSIIPELVGQSNRLTIDQINQMHADNADICGHSNASFGDSTPPFGAPKLETDAEITAYLNNTARPFLDRYPKNSGNRLWSWGQGIYRRIVSDPDWPEDYGPLIQKSGFMAGRKTSGRGVAYRDLGVENPFILPAVNLGLGGAESAVIVSQILDQIEAQSTDIIFYGHEFIASPSSGTHFPAADWPIVTADLRARADANRIDLMSLAQYAEDLGILGPAVFDITFKNSEQTLSIGSDVDVSKVINMSNPIERYRGDSTPDQISFVDSAGDALSVEGLTFRLSINSVEEPVDDTTQILQMTGLSSNPATGIVQFSPSVAEASALPIGLYFYDIQAYRNVGDVIQTIAKNTYTVLQDITKDQD